MGKQQDVLATLMDEKIRLEREAEAATDKFNKGYFEGRAEQCNRIIGCINAPAAESLSYLTDD